MAVAVKGAAPKLTVVGVWGVRGLYVRLAAASGTFQRRASCDGNVRESAPLGG